MGRDADDGSLERLLDERGQQFMRAAIALTGSRADGEDLQRLRTLAGSLGFLDDAPGSPAPAGLPGEAGHPQGDAAHTVTAALRPGMTLAGGRP